MSVTLTIEIINKCIELLKDREKISAFDIKDELGCDLGIASGLTGYLIKEGYLEPLADLELKHKIIKDGIDLDSNF